MHGKALPRHPSLEQYRKQAKDLVRLRRSPETDPRYLERLLKMIQQFHPRFRHKSTNEIREARFALSDAQWVLAREHGFESWPRFAKHVETARREAAGEAKDDAATAFLRAACSAPGVAHGRGTLEEAESVLKAHPEVARASIYAAAVLGDAAGVRRSLEGSNDAADDAAELAMRRGGVHGWDALTYLCFSRYLRLTRRDGVRSEGFVAAARALLDAGASADTGWFEANDEPLPFWESAIYGAAGVAQHAGLTRLLLERGADPNDEETAYHAAEGYDHDVLRVLLESGKLDAGSMTTLLLRKGDWHDAKGMELVLKAGADPNSTTHWRRTPLQHTVLRDNSIDNIALQLNYWPYVQDGPGRRLAPENVREGESMAWIAARRGRGDVLDLLERRGFAVELAGVQRVIAACARGEAAAVTLLAEAEPGLRAELAAEGGRLLAEFAGNGNVEGIRLLLELGIDAGAPNLEPDTYFDIAKGGTALHTAAWRMQHAVVRLLIESGAPVNATDGKGRTALALAVKACVDSYWKERRSPESVAMLLGAGAAVGGVEFPSGYAEADKLLRIQMK
jgi:ankyrin repeat protein